MEMLEYTAQKTNTIERLETNSTISSFHKTLLDSIFPTQNEDAKVANLKRALSEKASYFTDEELLAMSTDIQHLIECWLDDFEEGIFDGKTLENLLKGADHGY